ncbi:MAG: HPr-rel-A system PqqD family peptide chaperone [Magnetospiraceae bacterium]
MAEEISTWTMCNGVLFKIWEDGGVAYDNTSGESHALEPVMAILIEEIADSEAEPVSLMARFADRLDVDMDDPNVRVRFQDLLQTLTELRLIRQITP